MVGSRKFQGVQKLSGSFLEPSEEFTRASEGFQKLQGVPEGPCDPVKPSEELHETCRGVSRHFRRHLERVLDSLKEVFGI